MFVFCKYLLKDNFLFCDIIAQNILPLLHAKNSVICFIPYCAAGCACAGFFVSFLPKVNKRLHALFPLGLRGCACGSCGNVGAGLYALYAQH
jgi:hypothetical protein